MAGNCSAKLQEGYLVYECNQMCKCNKTCPNRILQNGIRVKLEVYKTQKKVILFFLDKFQITFKACCIDFLLFHSQGWAVRAGEAILRGTFVCEYIGEVLDKEEEHNRRRRFTFFHYVVSFS